MAIYTIDLETYYDSDYSLSKMLPEHYVNDERFELLSASIKKDAEEATTYFGEEAQQALKDLPLEQNIMLAHNTRFDALILDVHLGKRAAFYLDTMLMSNALIKPVTGSSSLFNVCQHLGLRMDKTTLMNMKGKRLSDLTAMERAKLKEYNTRDVDATYELWRLLHTMAPTPSKIEGYAQSYPRSELKLIDLSLRMYLDPVLETDESVFQDIVESEIAHKKELREKCGLSESTLRSIGKTAEVLRKRGVEVPTKKDTNDNGDETEKDSFRKTDPAVLALLSHPDEKVRSTIEARLAHASTINQRRSERLLSIAQQYGKLRAPLLYYGAHTGRFSGTDKINLQNLSNKSPIKKGLKAPDGYKIVNVDAAQIECRMTAWFCGQWDQLRAFELGRDLYADLASSVFGYEVSKATHPTERFIGKVGVLSCGYGTSARTFHNMLYAQGYKPKPGEDVMALAQRTVDTYRGKNRAIKNKWNVLQRMLQWLLEPTMGTMKVGCVLFERQPYNKYIWLPNGMPLIYSGLKSKVTDDRENFYFTKGKETVYMHGPKTLENIIQALACIIVKNVALQMQSEGYSCALTVHDDLTFVVPEDEAQYVHDRVVELLSTPPSWAPDLPLAAEGKISDTYGG